ncbi:hypothetical protein B0G62_102188 [Paraburkholderia eburnea]|uniref:Uncharacterized protein n=1 Tax=Paraburkholderia eburnea TaxID=1189126 RepID=A0A2S4MIL9_9BURK|nr:hypothetical protein [Paraburkholderia eburnea]POR54580.1 hypothetical protein B0G62_102188 [Paraburkholderia eburnea]PRZ24820.1 hypothetical protein BX588_103541 [Paraburkholderia eburnea]
MQTKAQQYQAIVRWYKEETGKQSVDMHDVARFAISKGVKPPTPKTPEALLAEKLSAASREETAVDSATGRPYRVNFAVTQWSGKDQMTLWHTLDEAPRNVAHKGLMQRREQMVGDAVSLSDDADHWNRVHPEDEAIQIPLDFEFDVMLRRNAPPDEDEQKAA